jgi:hypothetical protein
LSLKSAQNWNAWRRVVDVRQRYGCDEIINDAIARADGGRNERIYWAWRNLKAWRDQPPAAGTAAHSLDLDWRRLRMTCARAEVWSPPGMLRRDTVRLGSKTYLIRSNMLT